MSDAVNESHTEQHSLNQAEDSEEYLEELEEDYQEPRMSVGPVIRTYSVVSSSPAIPSTARTASELVLLQRREAESRRQRARRKIMGNRGMPSTINCYRIVPQHTAPAANDTRQQLGDQNDYQDLEEGYQEPRMSIGPVVQRGTGKHLRTYSGKSNPATATTASELALLPRKSTKSMENRGIPSILNCNQVVPQHTTAAAIDARQQRGRLGRRRGRGDRTDAMHVASSRRPRSTNFSLKESFDLLKIWSAPMIQWQLGHNSKNFNAWAALSHSMHKMGHFRTALQCRYRIQTLVSIHHRIKKSNQDYRSFRFPYYKLIGEVLDLKKKITAKMGVELSPELAQFIKGKGIKSNLNSTQSASFTEHNSLSNGSSNMSEPKVISPIGMEPQASGSRSFADKPSQDEEQYNRTTTVEDGSLPLEHEQKTEYLDKDDSYMMSAGGESPSVETGKFSGARSVKRPFSSSFEYTRGGNVVVGNAAKRPRFTSTARSASSTQMNDPFSRCLVEIVDIERQRLEVEREREENERAMMNSMMQFLQVIVKAKEMGNETDNDREGIETEFAGTEEEEEDNEIRHMIEQEEDYQLPNNGEPEND